MKQIFIIFLTLAALISSSSQSFGRTSQNIPLNIGLALYDWPDIEIVRLRAVNTDVDTTLETFWDEDDLYAFPAAAAVLTVSSDNAADTSAGTGAQTVLVKGLDANFVEISETITMNGQTEVSTVNSYLRIQGNGLEVQTVGSNEFNVGRVYVGSGTVTAGKPAVVLGIIRVGINNSDVGVYTVPAGKKLFASEVSLSIDANKAIELRSRVRPDGGVWKHRSIFDAFSGSEQLILLYGQPILEKTDFEVLSLGTAAGVGKANIIFLQK